MVFTILVVLASDMLRTLGVPGIIGLLFVLVGVGVIAYVDPLIGAGVTAILVGIGFIIGSVVRKLMRTFGMSGMI